MSEKFEIFFLYGNHLKNVYKIKKYSIMFLRSITNENIIWKIGNIRRFKRYKRKKYKLIDILIMTIYGILCGLTDFTNIADFLKLKEEYFVKLLKLENGTPSHDCLSDVFSAVDSKKIHGNIYRMD